MRQLAVLPDADARVLADHLLTLRIRTKLDPEGDGVGVWICDEDRVADARAELAAFRENPYDPKYQGAAAAAAQIRSQEAKTEREYHRRQDRFNRVMLLGGGGAVTTALVVVCIVVGLYTKFGEDVSNRGVQLLLIEPMPFNPADWREIAAGQDPDAIRAKMQEFSDYFTNPALTRVKAGEVWRLFTPMLLHWSFIHLAFNMSALWTLGSRIESKLGPWRFALLVLALSGLSNVAEFYLDFSHNTEFRLVSRTFARFGGMSGVIFGLAGYLWIKGRYDPDSGLGIDQQEFTYLLVWCGICVFGVVGNVANVAHIGGLLAGMAFAYAPLLFRRD